MNSENYETGGASIIPSARRSIHSHLNCPFATAKNMVSYGLTKNKSNLEGNSESEQGLDEVDNVLSKPMHPIHSSPQIRRENAKRNSFSVERRFHTEDEDDNSDDSSELSKSMPAALPSYSYYSDPSDGRNTSRGQYHSNNISYHTVSTPNRSSNRSHNLSTPSIYNTPTHNQKQKINNNAYKITILSILGVIVAICLSTMQINDVTNECAYDKSKFYTDLGGLGEKYNVDEYSILQVQTGISTIVEKQDTGSFMFVYNTDDNNFNLREFNKFVHDVALAASKYLRNDSTPLHYTMVEGTKLDMEEHSELISRYREDLAKTGLMLVRHVEDIPSALAMAFHYYCDEYNPLVKKSAVFFTLNLAKCPKEPAKKSHHAIIEKCLGDKWSSVPVDSIRPLLTRVVGVVIDVTTAF